MHRPFVLLLALAAGGCATSGAIPQPFPAPAGPSAAPSPSPVPTSADGYALAGTALSLRGAPYRNGGSDPAGFDCSGFVWYVFARHGVRMPRTVAAQYREGSSVDSHDLRAGDLVFFDTGAGAPSHVGISIGGDEFVHAPSTAGWVRVERLATPYWAGRIVGARRVK
jgi:cell wall-associated NlpC family hydrolase